MPFAILCKSTIVHTQYSDNLNFPNLQCSLITPPFSEIYFKKVYINLALVIKIRV